jgi:hypothetical protein
MLGFQMFWLIQAAIYIPATPFQIFNTKFHRTDCLLSGKGGKRPFKAMTAIDANPCFCTGPGTQCLRNSDKTVISGTCPIGTATCMATINGTSTEVKPYISHFRNCIGGQGSSCTKQQPCYPCERSRLPEWGKGSSGSARCRMCSSEFSGDCQFIPGVGPYCFDKPGSKNVVPCKKCCTEPAPLIVGGVCY